MGQASKRSPIRSTSGRLGWRMVGLYKEEAPIKNRACNLKGEERKKRKLYSYILELL